MILVKNTAFPPEWVSHCILTLFREKENWICKHFLKKVRFVICYFLDSSVFFYLIELSMQWIFQEWTTSLLETVPLKYFTSKSLTIPQRTHLWRFQRSNESAKLNGKIDKLKRILIGGLIAHHWSRSSTHLGSNLECFGEIVPNMKYYPSFKDITKKVHTKYISYSFFIWSHVALKISTIWALAVRNSWQHMVSKRELSGEECRLTEGSMQLSIGNHTTG